MRSWRESTAMRIVAFSVCATFLLVPVGGAGHGQLVGNLIHIEDLDGFRLASPAVGQSARLIADLVWLPPPGGPGNASDPNQTQETGPVLVTMSIVGPNGFFEQRTANPTPDRTYNATTRVEFTWLPSETGNYRVQFKVGDQAGVMSRTFSVVDTARPEGSLTDRVLDHSFVFLLFVASSLLFLAVVVARQGEKG